MITTATATDSHPDGRRRTDPIAIHTYTLPLVRELTPASRRPSRRPRLVTRPANDAASAAWAAPTLPVAHRAVTAQHSGGSRQGSRRSSSATRAKS
jgi:hypothetical protein